MSTRAQRAAALLWSLALLFFARPGEAAPEAPLTLRQASAALIVEGRTLRPREIELPLHWDAVFKGWSGSADLTLRFDMPPDAAARREPHALFITRLGSAYEIELNGVLLTSAGTLAGNLAGKRDRWRAKHPVRLSFPSRLLAEHNELRIRIRAESGARAGLSVVQLGTENAIAPLAQRAELLRVALPLATSVFSLLVAGFCALLWWQQRDALYAWAGIGEALWAVAVADAVLEVSPLPWPYWGVTLLLLRAAWVWSLYAIAQEVCGRRPRIEYWTVLAVQASVPLCLLLMFVLRSTQPLLIWYVVAISTFAWVNLRLAVQAWRAPSSQRLMIVLCLFAVLAASVRDAIAGRWDASLYAESAWAKYVAVLVGAALLWIVSQRFLQARAEVLSLNASLADRVAQKEHELRDSFQRLSELESSRAVLAERERILRDMHDGVGSSLATAVRQLEGGRALPHEVVQMLRESMDHLKLSIDAMNLPAGDVNALLASLRYRLQPRIESAGLQVRWNVAPLPRWAAGHDEAMRHLQFLVLEVISNVLQHAKASTLSLAAEAVDAGIRITLSDDGCGIRAAPGHAVRSLEVRADAIGAALSIEPAAPGTRVTLTLPAAPGVRATD